MHKADAILILWFFGGSLNLSCPIFSDSSSSFTYLFEYYFVAKCLLHNYLFLNFMSTWFYSLTLATSLMHQCQLTVLLFVHRERLIVLLFMKIGLVVSSLLLQGFLGCLVWVLEMLVSVMILKIHFTRYWLLQVNISACCLVGIKTAAFASVFLEFFQ